METYRVMTYNVGQGLFNLLQIFNEEGECIFCGVFDCGSTSRLSAEKEEKLENAVSKIHEAGRLDYVVISHQDIDHWRYVRDLIKMLYNAEENIWYKSGNHLIKYCKKGDISIEEMYWEGKTRPTQAAECKYTCTYENSDAVIKLIQITRGRELTWLVEGGVSEKRSEYFNIYGIFEGDNIVYTRIWRPGTIPDPSDKLLSQKIFEEIRTYIEKHASHFGLSDYHVPKVSDMIIEAFQRAITFSAENKKVLDLCSDIAIKYVYLGGEEGGDNGYRDLKNFFAAYTNNVRRINRSAILHINDETWEGFNFDPNVSQNSKQSTSNKQVRYNATSLTACYMLSNDMLLFFPGDATIHTFGKLHDIVHERYDDNPVEFITAPHHGAYDTNIVLDKNGNQTPNGQTVINFFDTFIPQKVVISAKHTKYGHPSGVVVQFMIANTASTHFGDHFVFGYNRNKQIDFGTATKHFLFTTEDNGNVCTTSEGMRGTTRKIKRFLPFDDMYLSRNGVKL